jgi:hypothetical protein
MARAEGTEFMMARSGRRPGKSEWQKRLWKKVDEGSLVVMQVEV